jgi:sigma-B regulation protein RsbU (phosphoserine phosphatase)
MSALISWRYAGGTPLNDQALEALRGQVAGIISGTVFVFVGLVVCVIAAMRRRSGVHILIWLGIWSAMDGERPMLYSLNAMGLLPHWMQVGLPYVDTVVSYLILVVALLAWRELSLGKLRGFLQAVVLIGLAIAVAGVAFFLRTGATNKLMPYNNLLAACTLAVLGTVVALPRLTRKFMVTPHSGVLLVGTLAFALQAVYTNVLGSLGRTAPAFWGTLGFAVLLFSFAYVALQMVFANEHRLHSIENELAIARQIQNSILPSGSPEITNLHISAAYHPMTAVAGDFYDFLPVDQHRVGVLVADVSGHGVPAALIATMMKMAVKSIIACVHSPGDVLQGLNRMLSGQAPDQFVTAAYLFIDTQNYKARYSAAGHPPLLLSRGGILHRIESNGLVFGVTPQPDYPVRDIPIYPGDRLLLYTDGVIEPENAKGKPFGDSKLEQVVLGAQMCPPSELTDRLLTEIRVWQPPSMAQQDDITPIVIDVV